MITINASGLIIIAAIGYVGIDAIVKGVKRAVKSIVKKAEEKK